MCSQATLSPTLGSPAQSTLNLNQIQNNRLHVNTHDPAITQSVEQIAQARHRESMASTEGMVSVMVSEMNRRFEAYEQSANNRMHQLMMLAERREGQFREENSCSKGKNIIGF